MYYLLQDHAFFKEALENFFVGRNKFKNIPILDLKFTQMSKVRFLYRYYLITTTSLTYYHTKHLVWFAIRLLGRVRSLLISPLQRYLTGMNTGHFPIVRLRQTFVCLIIFVFSQYTDILSTVTVNLVNVQIKFYIFLKMKRK